MFTSHGSKARQHRRVIHEDGSPAETTARLSRLRFALRGGMQREDFEATIELPRALTAPTRTLPVVGRGVVALRVPQQPKVRPGDWVRFGFARMSREVGELVKVLSTGARALAAENDARAVALDERLEALGRRVRAWTIESMDQDLSLAYAEGGTELVLKMTPEVLARLDAVKASAGTQVAV